MLIRDWMTSYVYTATPESSVSEVVQLMKEKKVKHLPIVSKSVVVGIVSDRGIKEYLPSKGTSLDIYELNYILAKTTIKEVMIKDVVTVHPDTPVEEACMTMFDKDIGCLPVTEQGKLVGIISDKDMFRVLVEITGVRRGGHRISLSIEDRPGSIRDLADLIRKFGFRWQSILSTSEKAAPGQRYIVIRTRGEGDFPALKKELETQYSMIRIL